jgi:hypothetical protein
MKSIFKSIFGTDNTIMMTTTEIGNLGEKLFRDELQKCQGKQIAGFIRTKNIIYFGKNFQIDFLIFVPKIGLVVAEVKNWKGTVKATSQDKWIQEIYTYKNEFGNASQQVLRTSGLVLQILEKGKINKWPIRPLVVFTHDDAKILRAKGELAPQTDIILKSMIKSWIEDNSTDEIFYKFTKQEFDAVKDIISKYSSEYRPA